MSGSTGTSWVDLVRVPADLRGMIQLPGPESSLWGRASYASGRDLRLDVRGTGRVTILISTARVGEGQFSPAVDQAIDLSDSARSDVNILGKGLREWDMIAYTILPNEQTDAAVDSITLQMSPWVEVL